MRNTLLSFIAPLLLHMVIGASIVKDAGNGENNKEVGFKGNFLIDEKTKDGNHKFIYYISGVDYENRKVIVLEWGRWDIRGLTEKGGEEVDKFESSGDQFVELVRSDYFSQAGNDTDNDDTLVAIIDFDGLDLRQITAPASLKMFVKSLAKLQGTYEKFAYGFIVNANSLVHQLIHLSKPFMGKFLEKIEVYGTNSRQWIPNLLKKIPRNQLHPAYGGKKDFKPVAVYSLL